MTPTERLQNFVQDVNLTRFGRFVDDIADEEGVIEVAQTVAWTNMLLDELEREADWECVRFDDETITTVATSVQIVNLPSDVRKLVVNVERPLVLMQGDTVVSRFEVVDPNQITRRTGESTLDRVATVNGKLVFSRPFKDYEIGATIVADTIHELPRLVGLPDPDVTLFDTFKPYQLLVLGVAKNATLPDIVQGGLSPSFVQKYGNELEKAVAENNASSGPDTAVVENFGYIGGIY